MSEKKNKKELLKGIITRLNEGAKARALPLFPTS